MLGPTDIISTAWLHLHYMVNGERHFFQKLLIFIKLLALRVSVVKIMLYTSYQS